MTNGKKLSSNDLASIQGGRVSKSSAAKSSAPMASKGRAAGSVSKSSASKLSGKGR
jgi:hypothetical protein